MASSGDFLLDPNLAVFADEAFERAGLDPKAIESDHIISFRRSTAFIFSKWSNLGHRQWKFQEITHTTSINENFFDLPAGMIDVQTVIMRRGSVDTEMYPISRSDYLILADKTLTGRPDRYFIDRRRDTDSATRQRMFYWLSGENLTDQIVFNAFFQGEDPGNAQNTLDIPFRFHDAMAAEMAVRMAQKFKPERYAELKADAKEAFSEADDEDTESAPMTLSVQYGRRYGRR